MLKMENMEQLAFNQPTLFQIENTKQLQNENDTKNDTQSVALNWLTLIQIENTKQLQNENNTKKMILKVCIVLCLLLCNFFGP